MARYVALHNQKQKQGKIGPLPNYVYREVVTRAESFYDARNVFKDYAILWSNALSDRSDRVDVELLRLTIGRLRLADSTPSTQIVSAQDICEFGQELFTFMVQYKVRDIAAWNLLPYCLLSNYADNFPIADRQRDIAQLSMAILDHYDFGGNWVQRIMLRCRAQGYNADLNAVQKIYDINAHALVHTHNPHRQQAFSQFIAAFARCGSFDMANMLLIKALDISILPDIEAAWCLLQLSGKTNDIQVSQRLFDVLKSLYYGNQGGMASDSSQDISGDELVGMLKEDDSLRPTNFQIFAIKEHPRSNGSYLYSQPLLPLPNDGPPSALPSRMLAHSELNENSLSTSTFDPKPFDLYSAMLYSYAQALQKGRFNRYQNLEVYLQRRRVHVAWCRLITEIRLLRWPMAIEGYESLISCYVFANYDDYNLFSLNHVSRFLEEMLTHKKHPTMYAIHTIIRGYVNSLEKYLDFRTRARFIAEYMEFMETCGYTPNAQTYSIQFLAFLPRRKAKKSLKGALNGLKRTEQLMFQHNVAHTTESMNALLRVYGALQAFHDVYERLISMRELGVKRDARTYGTVFRSCQVSRFSAQYALQNIYPELLRERDVEQIITVDLYHTLISCAVTAQDQILAWKFYEDLCLRNFTPTHTVFNYLLKLSLFNNQPAKAQYVLDEMRRRRMFFDATTYFHLFTYFTRIQPDATVIYLLLRRIHMQNDMLQSWQHQRIYSPEARRSNSEDEVSLPPLYMPAPVNDDLPKGLRMPPMLPYPSTFVCAEQEGPQSVPIDSRLRLKILQHHLAADNLNAALRNYCSLINDYTLVMMNRQARTRAYRHRFFPDLQAHNVDNRTGPDNADYTKRIVAPNVLKLWQLNSQPGNLYLGKDVATAGWLLCHHLLSIRKKARKLTPLIVIQPVKQQVRHGRYDGFSDRIKRDRHGINHLEMFVLAKRVFMITFRTLKRYLGTGIMSRFEWVIDLAKKLGVHSDGLSTPRAKQGGIKRLSQTAYSRESTSNSSSLNVNDDIDGNDDANRSRRKSQHVRITTAQLLKSIQYEGSRLNEATVRPGRKSVVRHNKLMNLAQLYRTKRELNALFSLMAQKHRKQKDSEKQSRRPTSAIKEPVPTSIIALDRPTVSSAATPAMDRPWKWRKSSRRSNVQTLTNDEGGNNLWSESQKVPLANDNVVYRRNRRKRGGAWLKRKVSKRFIKAVDESLQRERQTSSETADVPDQPTDKT